MKHFFSLLLTLFICCGLNTYAQHWDTVGNIDFSGAYGSDADYATVKIDNNSVPYVAFRTSSSFNATVMKFNGNNWVSVGIPNFTVGGVGDLSLALNSNGTPYLAFGDGANASRASVMKYDGTSWVFVGSPGFSAGLAYTTSLAIDKNNIPYVAYEDLANGNKATVMKFNGTSWVPLGSVGFSAGAVRYTCLAIDTSGTPYVAYRDESSTSNGKATVMKYNGSSWVNVGIPAFTTGHVLTMSLAIDSSGTPYVAFNDTASQNQATVMKYITGAWVLVGSPGFSLAGEIRYLNIAINGNGTPYVAYSSNNFGAKITSKKFNGLSWIDAGNSYFSSGEADYTSIAIDRAGTPYVIYGSPAIPNFGATVKKLNLPAITGADSVCTGAGITLSDSVTGGTWVNGNPAVATVNAAGYVTGLSQGTDTITYIAGELPVTAIITVHPTPAVGTITGAATVCSGAQITLADAYPGGTWSALNTNAAVNAAGVVTGMTAGTDTIRYTATNYCGTGTQTKAIAIHRIPVTGPITGPANICGTGHITLADTTAGGTWAVAGPHAYATGSTITGAAPGTDEVLYIVSNECGADTAMHAITITPLPDTGTITGPAQVCAGAAITLADALTGAGTWSSSNTAVAVVAATGTVTGVAPGTAHILYTVTNGPCALSADRTIAVAPVVSSAITITATPPDSIAYEGEIVSFAATETYGGTAPTYQWYINGILQPGFTNNTMWTQVYGNITVTCVATSNLPCVSNATDTSNAITIYGSYLGVTGMQHTSTALAVYPDPNNGSFTANLSATANETAQVTITSMPGEKIKAFELTTNTPTPVQLNVPPGIYLLTATTGNGTYITRIVVE